MCNLRGFQVPQHGYLLASLDFFYHWGIQGSFYDKRYWSLKICASYREDFKTLAY